MLVDLHTHSTFSDGRYTPSQLVIMAAEAGIGILGITDHDSVNGIEEALNAAAAARRACNCQRRGTWHAGWRKQRTYFGL